MVFEGLISRLGLGKAGPLDWLLDTNRSKANVMQADLGPANMLDPDGKSTGRNWPINLTNGDRHRIRHRRPQRCQSKAP